MGRTQTAAAVFGERVRVLRAQRGWSQTVLGEHMAAQGFPMSKQTVANMENGARPTNVDELVGLARVFGMNMRSLIAPVDDEFLPTTHVTGTLGISRSVGGFESITDALIDRGVTVAMDPAQREAMDRMVESSPVVQNLKETVEGQAKAIESFQHMLTLFTEGGPAFKQMILDALPAIKEAVAASDADDVEELERLDEAHRPEGEK